MRQTWWVLVKLRFGNYLGEDVRHVYYSAFKEDVMIEILSQICNCSSQIITKYYIFNKWYSCKSRIYQLDLTSSFTIVNHLSAKSQLRPFYLNRRFWYTLLTWLDLTVFTSLLSQSFKKKQIHTILIMVLLFFKQI